MYFKNSYHLIKDENRFCLSDKLDDTYYFLILYKCQKIN